MREIFFGGSQCLFCFFSLYFIVNRPPMLVARFYIDHTEEVLHRLKRCGKCKNIYHYSHYTKSNDRFCGVSLAKYFYADTLKKQYFLGSSSTGFTSLFLQTFMSEIYSIPESSCFAKANVYNMSVSSGNIALNNEALSDAFFLYALLSMIDTYHKPIEQLQFGQDLESNIMFYLPQIKSGFVQKSSQHRCDVTGCGRVVGFDADAKVSKNNYSNHNNR